MIERFPRNNNERKYTDDQVSEWREERFDEYPHIVEITTPKGTIYERWEGSPKSLQLRKEEYLIEDLSEILAKEFPGHPIQDFQFSAKGNIRGYGPVVSLLPDYILNGSKTLASMIPVEKRPKRSDIDDFITTLAELRKRLYVEDFANRINEIEEMAHGADPNGERASAFEGWADEDFLEAIRGLQ